MPDNKGKVVVEAHALRTATAMAALLHGSRKGPRDLKRPVSLLIVSAIVGALLLVAFWGISRVGSLLQQQKRPRAEAVALVVSQVEDVVLVQEALGRTSLAGR
jgi:hypothetical protein